MIKRFYYNRVNKTCEVFYYGGCFGNGNNFLSKTECELKYDNTPVNCNTSMPTITNKSLCS
ncbi:unnamed protein product [Schistosoma margrebowiei]|uniref:BPTI/Kunitz inhibitor domain-containing protein n=1 Tax=Schistosoma margrebowiei TaxID=48269 RepID=A0A3P8CQZ7_9TREM|nr:unnamed protein product [Schistosoma margrebowiei]